MIYDWSSQRSSDPDSNSPGSGLAYLRVDGRLHPCSGGTWVRCPTSNQEKHTSYYVFHRAIRSPEFGSSNVEGCQAMHCHGANWSLLLWGQGMGRRVVKVVTLILKNILRGRRRNPPLQWGKERERCGKGGSFAIRRRLQGWEKNPTFLACPSQWM